jgi:dGTPase
MPALVGFSPAMAGQSARSSSSCFATCTGMPQVTQTTQQAQQVVRELFAAYQRRPGTDAGRLCRAQPTMPAAVADYIAGMTDRFAAREHERLTGLRLLDVAAA